MLQDIDRNAAYCFDLLPFHPKPENLEAYTGYVIRLAEGNCLRSVNNASSILFPNKSRNNIYSFADYYPSSFGLLPHIAACNEMSLRATTFYYITHKFARSLVYASSFPLIKASIANGLRYCPYCLSERPYYILPWRFHILEACTHHRCELLDRCGHCGHKIPLLPSLLKVGICPLCHGRLDTCAAKEVDEDKYYATQRLYQDLEFLLTPQDIDGIVEMYSQLIPYIIGHCITEMRNERHMNRNDVACAIGSEERNIMNIELNKSGVEFRNYLNIINYFWQYMS